MVVKHTQSPYKVMFFIINYALKIQYISLSPHHNIKQYITTTPFCIIPSLTQHATTLHLSSHLSPLFSTLLMLQNAHFIFLNVAFFITLSEIPSAFHVPHCLRRVSSLTRRYDSSKMEIFEKWGNVHVVTFPIFHPIHYIKCQEINITKYVSAVIM